MHRVYVSVPVWGERCLSVFCATALPALEKAMNKLECDSVLVVHTDQPRLIRDSATSLKVHALPVPAGLREFDCMSQAHREVFNMAIIDDVVVPLTADMVISEDSLLFCDSRLANGSTKLIACAAPRALQEGMLPEKLNGVNLLAWAWKNRHPMTSQALWPNGKTGDLSRTYFVTKNGGVVARWCLPHPLAIKIDNRVLSFTPTVDANLINNFHPAEIHVVTTPLELGVVELSPRDKGFSLTDSGIHEKLESGTVKIYNQLQRWVLNHKIMIVGEPEQGDDDMFVRRVLS